MTLRIHRPCRPASTCPISALEKQVRSSRFTDGANGSRMNATSACSRAQGIPIGRRAGTTIASSLGKSKDSLASSCEVETWVYQATVKAALERGTCSEDQSQSSRDHLLVLAMTARKLRSRAKSDKETDPLPYSRRSVKISRRIQKIVDSLPKELRAVPVLCDLGAVRNAIKRPRGSAATASPCTPSQRAFQGQGNEATTSPWNSVYCVGLL